jgi:hypothetical protein
MEHMLGSGTVPKGCTALPKLDFWRRLGLDFEIMLKSQSIAKQVFGKQAALEL